MPYNVKNKSQFIFSSPCWKLVWQPYKILIHHWERRKSGLSW